MTQIFNREPAEPKRRVLRRNAPPAEDLVWKHLRASQLANAKFRRQYSVGFYILDFYCAEVQLAVELDGPSHDGEEAATYDAERQAAIETLGITFLRFTNRQVYDGLEGVLEMIARRVGELRVEKAERAELWERRVRNRKR